MAVLTPTGRARTADGVEIAYYDFGGMGPDLLLAHATGFCGAVLAPLAAGLAGQFRCVGFDERGHGQSQRPPGGDFGWYGFAADVLAVVDRLELDQPTGFGHSCGGAALLLAEEARPGTFSGLYCYEPILYPGQTALAPGFESNPLAGGALRRREVFGSRAEALANYGEKAPFDRLDEDVLALYVENGFGPDPEGIRLRCRREDEAQVYAHGFSHDAFVHLGGIGCPVTLACGAETDAAGPGFLTLLDGRLRRSAVEVLDGLGHFGPMEDPGALAQSVKQSVTRSSARERGSDTTGA